MASRNRSALSRHLRARSASPRDSATPAKPLRFGIRNQASQPLSPLPSCPTRFMPSFQSPEPISGKSVGPGFQAAIEGPGAMFVHAGGLFRNLRLEIGILAALGYLRSFQEGRQLFQHALVSGDFQVMQHRIGQPHPVVGEMRAHAPSRRRMPPMLHVPLRELPRGSPHDLLPGQGRVQGRQGHDVLQLIPESECAAGLIESGARPQAGTPGSGMAASG